MRSRPFLTCFQYANQEANTNKLRASKINNYPKIAQNFDSDTRRSEVRISCIFKPLSNAVAGLKDKQEWNFLFQP